MRGLLVLLGGLLLAAPLVRADEEARRWIQAERRRLGPQDVPGRHRLMDIARDHGLYDLMRELAREILRLDPQHAAAHRHLGHTYYRGRWLTPREAEAAGLKRFDYTFPPGYPTPEKDRLLFPLYLTERDWRRHEKHQHWENAWVYERKPLRIRSNCTREKIERFAAAFRQFARFVSRFFGIPLKSHYEINIFRSKEEYHRLGRGPRGTGGYYAPYLRKLFLYDDPRDQSTTYRVLFHEGTHMIVHLTCKNKNFRYPICINEGLAEYMAAARWDYYRRRYTFGHPLNDRIKQLRWLLKAGKPLPLKDLVLHPRRGFGSAAYAQAWALITYLSDRQVGHSPRRLGLYLKRLYKDNPYRMLPDGDPRKREAMAKIFARTFFNEKDGATWEAFQEKFWTYSRTRLREEVGAPDFSRRYRRRAGVP